jgi:hypothetical protein
MRLFFSALSWLILLPSVGQTQDRGAVISRALQYVLREDIRACEAQPCSPVRVLIPKDDLALLPTNLGIVIIPVSPDSLDSVREPARLLSFQEVHITGEFAKIRIIELTKSRVPDTFAPAPLPIRFRDSGHGWTLLLARTSGGWIVVTGEEWIS